MSKTLKKAKHLRIILSDCRRMISGQVPNYQWRHLKQLMNRERTHLWPIVSLRHKDPISSSIWSVHDLPWDAVPPGWGTLACQSKPSLDKPETDTPENLWREGKKREWLRQKRKRLKSECAGTPDNNNNNTPLPRTSRKGKLCSLTQGVATLDVGDL